MLALLLALISCGDEGSKKVEQLESFRILGAIASAPEVTPGSAVSVQLLVSDVNGLTSTITGTYEGCIDPGISRGAQVRCDHDPNRISGNYTIDFTTLTPSSDLRTGLNAASVSFNVPNNILAGRGSREQFNGVAYIIIFRFSVDGREQISFKRILATNRGSLNTNPSGADILLNGGSLSQAPMDGDNLVASVSAPENFDFITVDGITEQRLEDQEVAWYVSTGEIDKPKSDIGDTVEYKTDSAYTPMVVMAVIRDGRGGMTFVKRYFP